MTPALDAHRAIVAGLVRDHFRSYGHGPATQRVYFIMATTVTLVHGVHRYDARHIKIGISRDPVKRVRDLQSATPAELKLMGVTPYVPNAELLEGSLHSLFEERRVRGEWFCLSLELYATVHDLCKRSEVWAAVGVAA